MTNKRELFIEISNQQVTEGDEVVGYLVKNSRMNELEKALLAPAQPEPEIPFGYVEPIEVTDDMVYAFHNQLSDSALGSDEFTDIKHGLCAALMNIPRPAQPVMAEQWRSFVTDADIAALHRFVECCDDPESGGHDLEKEQVQRLEQIGALQRSGLISYITDFGNYLISATAPINAQPVSEPYKLSDGRKLVPFDPAKEMFCFVRDWSIKGVGNDQATGCNQAMLAAPAQESE